MASRASTHRRPGRRTGPNPIPSSTQDVPVQQPAQPSQPPVQMTDEALALIWQQEGAEIDKARGFAALAEPLEKSATDNRETARLAREKAQKLVDDAARMEAQANEEERQARLHRQEETFHLDNARRIGAAVNFLGSTNDLTHPHIRKQQRDQAAAANGHAVQFDPADPLGDRVASGDLSETAPFQVQEATR